MSLTSAFITDVGKARSINQDSVFADEKGDYGIYVVSDGMGGHSKGEMASGKAIEMIGDWWKRNYTILKSCPRDVLIDEISKMIQFINETIYNLYQEMGLTGGATFSLLIIMESSYLMFTIGDSRIFQVSGRNVNQISVDDVWENLAENRKKEESILLADTRYGTLTQAIGFDRTVSPRMCGGEAKKGSFYFLCSDGIYKYCPEKTLQKILVKAKKKQDLKSVLLEIKEKVYEHGAGDNLTGILVRV